MRLCLFLVLLISWSGPYAAADDGKRTIAVENRLTDEEEAAGWRLLFDGETTRGWTGMRNLPFPHQSWAIEQGALRTLDDGSGGDIRTTRRFENFELAFDWMISPKGNSGLKYLVQEEWVPASFRPDLPDARRRSLQLSAVGLEYQLLDDANLRPGRETSGLGALYLLVAPQKKEVHGPGEWNSARVLVDGGHVEHWLNGHKIVEYELGSKDLLERVKQTKFRQMPGYGIKGPGYIALQHHGHPAWFRNLKVRRLP